MAEFPKIFSPDNILAKLQDGLLNPVPAGMGVLGDWDNLDDDNDNDNADKSDKGYKGDAMIIDSPPADAAAPASRDSPTVPDPVKDFDLAMDVDPPPQEKDVVGDIPTADDTEPSRAENTKETAQKPAQQDDDEPDRQDTQDPAPQAKARLFVADSQESGPEYDTQDDAQQGRHSDQDRQPKPIQQEEESLFVSGFESDPPSPRQELEAKTMFEISLPEGNINPDDYSEPDPTEDFVTQIVREHEGHGEPSYTIMFEDDSLNTHVPLHQVRQYHNGKRALKAFARDNDAGSLSMDYTDDELTIVDERHRGSKRRKLRSSTQKSVLDFFPLGDDSGLSERGATPVSATSVSTRSTRHSTRVTRSSVQPDGKGAPTTKAPKYVDALHLDEFDELSMDAAPIIESDIAPRTKSRLRQAVQLVSDDGEDSSFEPEEETTRRSGRSTRTRRNMRDVINDDVEEYRSATSTGGAPKVFGMKEQFRPLPQEFEDFHSHGCDTCGGHGSNTEKGKLIFCQGCSLSYHKFCLGGRNQREHIVTKVAEAEFVLQCRFCVSVSRKKDPMAPSHDMCQCCHQKGISCKAFSEKKSSRQEEKIRRDNDGVNPITPVKTKLLNNTANLLFRCVTCHRGIHFSCLPPRWSKVGKEKDPEARLSEYSNTWQCKDCGESVNTLGSLIAWRPVDRDAYTPGQTWFDFDEDSKEYLVKWQKRSYYHCQWASGAWIFGVAPVQRANFPKRNEGINLEPKLSSKDAIPDEYLLIDIILKVKYNVGDTQISSREDGMQKIGDIANVMVKFQGLGYDNVVWDAPPSRDSGAFWTAFKAAYIEYLNGKHFKSDSAKRTRDRIIKFRQDPFQTLSGQPEGLAGGKLMEYQLEGVDWLRYNFHKEHSVILADEMGLGKTIQIVGLITSLIETPECGPFLVVVPNSTCPNWRREFKQWAPDVRLVSYHGGREAQELIYNHELFPERHGPMKAHVVVMSYDSAQDTRTQVLFKKIQWSGLVVDEGQRLKNDRNLLYGALRGMKIPWSVLLTGTPLQNDKRELFNLLQFIDSTKDAAILDEEYANLTADNIPKLHELIRPYFLRRTKAQVLKFLPPMAQIIMPVSMTFLQQKLSRSIMAKNPALIKSIFAKGKIKPADRGSLNNILMQLRKCLCHPFVYSRAIEERDLDQPKIHRNLIEASSKLIILDLMLPKLKADGHRVLIFSQFLDNLDLIEDYLTGAGFMFQRLDGRIGSAEKQKRIDLFNGPDSRGFVFLLSTRAGGVGINLATADTVIILDPDFNPHQDVQALSRAHRIGQKNKVLCIQIITKNSVEEKIMQVGRKKMALDHALIETMEDKEVSGNDLETVLKHAAKALFSDDDKDTIRYDEASVAKLLDRTHIVDKADKTESSATTNQFSFARVWETDKGELTDQAEVPETEDAPINPDIWESILKQREQDALLEVVAMGEHNLGRGGRRRQAVKYNGNADDDVIIQDDEVVIQDNAEVDGDFQLNEVNEQSDDEWDEPQDDMKDLGVGENVGVERPSALVGSVPVPALELEAAPKLLPLSVLRGLSPVVTPVPPPAPALDGQPVRPGPPTRPLPGQQVHIDLTGSLPSQQVPTQTFQSLATQPWKPAQPGKQSEQPIPVLETFSPALRPPNPTPQLPVVSPVPLAVPAFPGQHIRFKPPSGPVPGQQQVGPLPGQQFRPAPPTAPLPGQQVATPSAFRNAATQLRNPGQPAIKPQPPMPRCPVCGGFHQPQFCHVLLQAQAAQPLRVSVLPSAAAGAASVSSSRPQTQVSVLAPILDGGGSRSSGPPAHVPALAPAMNCEASAISAASQAQAQRPTVRASMAPVSTWRSQTPVPVPAPANIGGGGSSSRPQKQVPVPVLDNYDGGSRISGPQARASAPTQSVHDGGSSSSRPQAQFLVPVPSSFDRRSRSMGPQKHVPGHPPTNGGASRASEISLRLQLDSINQQTRTREQQMKMQQKQQELLVIRQQELVVRQQQELVMQQHQELERQTAAQQEHLRMQALLKQAEERERKRKAKREVERRDEMRQQDLLRKEIEKLMRQERVSEEERVRAEEREQERREEMGKQDLMKVGATQNGTTPGVATPMAATPARATPGMSSRSQATKKALLQARLKDLYYSPSSAKEPEKDSKT